MSEIPLVFSCNKKFLPYAMVCAVSAVRKTQRKLRLYFLTDDSVTEKDRRDFFKTFRQFENVQAQILDVSKLCSFKDSASSRFPKIVYYRFLIPELLEKEGFEKCIYLDSDMTVLTDIGELFDIPLNGKLLGACRCPFMASHIQKQEKMPDGTLFEEYTGKIVKKKENYFISACLVFNLKEIRERGKGFWEKAKKMDGTFLYCPDQDILNMVFENEVYFLPPEWCCSPTGTEGEALPEAKILHAKMWTASFHLSDDVWFRDLKFTPYCYRIRAEYLALLFERSINNVLRPAKDGIIKSFLLFSWHFFAALASRVLQWRK